MKGISPLVATVLLIAITMSIAGILAFWVSSYTAQTLPPINMTAEECRYSNFEILTCSIDSSSGNIIFSLHNVGPYDILNMTSYIFFNDGTISPKINLNDGLASGEYKSFVLSSSNLGFTSDRLSKIAVGSSACPSLSRDSGCTRS